MGLLDNIKNAGQAAFKKVSSFDLKENMANAVGALKPTANSSYGTSNRDALNSVIPTNPLSSSEYENLRYPSNLGSPEVNHYVCFFVNETNSLITEYMEMAQMFSPKEGQSLTNFRKFNNAAGLVGSDLSRVNSNIARANNTLAQRGNTSRQTTRINKMIALYMPPSIQALYSQNWKSEQLKLIGDLMQLTTAKEGSAPGLDLREIVGTAAHSLINDTLTGISNILGYHGANKAAEAAFLQGRIAFNPHREVIFEAPDFRSFSFEWKFMPDSPEESNEVREIIKTFKYYATPELNTSGIGRFWIYPAEFDIVFYVAGEENNYVNKISTCVLTDISVNYTPNRAYVPFRTTYAANGDLRGAPTILTLGLKFTEVEIMTRKRIEEGY